MRIPLAQTKRKPQARLRRHSTRGRKRFDDAIVIPARAPRRRTRSQAGERPARQDRQPTVRELAPPPDGTRVWPQFRRAIAVRWWVLLILLLLLGGTAYACSDERFFVYDAEIVGTQHLDAQAVYQAAGVDKQSIFWIDPLQVAQNVASLQGIKAVHVSCALPSSVVIRVEERQPIILWRSNGQQRDWWLDAEGMVLPYHGDPSAPDTVFVVDNSSRQLTPGARIDPPGLAASVIQMATSLSGVRVFFYDADRGLYFAQKTESGEWPVYVGDSVDLASKIQVSELLNRHFQDEGLRPTYVDVRWADRAVYGLPARGDTAGDQ